MKFIESKLLPIKIEAQDWKSYLFLCSSADEAIEKAKELKIKIKEVVTWTFIWRTFIMQ